MEWFAHVLTAVLTGGGMAAVFTQYLRVLNTRHTIAMANAQAEYERRTGETKLGFDQDRQRRLDGIEVLHRAVEDGRKDRDSLHEDIEKLKEDHKQELRLLNRDMSKLKSDYTAALMNVGRLELNEQALKAQNADLLKRVGYLEAEVERLRSP